MADPKPEGFKEVTGVEKQDVTVHMKPLFVNPEPQFVPPYLIPQCVVLISGGMDSAVLLAVALQTFGSGQVYGLSFDYGQRHLMELKAAHEICAYYRVPHDKLQIPDPQHLFKGASSPLVNPQEIIERMTYQEMKDTFGTVQTYVPFRNGLMLSMAVAYAYSRNIKNVWFAAHAEDARNAAYPDCTPEFVQYFAQAAKIGTGNRMEVVAPFIGHTKGQIVAIGARLHVPFERTLSCYEGTSPACGVCPTCVERKNAFMENGLTDPIPYQTPV